MKLLLTFILICFSYSLHSMETPRSQRPASTAESMPVPGCVIVEIPGERTSQDSRASVLSEIPTQEIFAEALERLTEIVESQQQESTAPSSAPVVGTICYQTFLQCYKSVNRVKPCVTPLIFIAGVSTILADAIMYAGGSNTQKAGYVSLGVMSLSVILTSTYLICKYFYRKQLPILP